ncbi:MAG: LacI family DNA-binding transcriptional regulator [Actinomycetales bacterium]
MRLYDIAREAGVAASTVSRALANPERVNFQTLEHIRSVAERLGYRSGSLQDSASGTGRKMLDLLVQDISNPFYAGLAKGAESQARAAGYLVVLGDAEESAQLERLHIQRLLGTVDGFIIAARWLSAADLLELDSQRSVVLFNREVKGLSSVVTDAEDGSRQIIEHLASLGHTRVLYLAGPRLSWSDGRRWRGLSRAADEAGILLTKAGPYQPIFGQGAAAAEVALAHGATAVVAFNDQLAIGVLRRLQHRGTAVPERISVVSYDDTFGSDFCQPPLTCLTAPVEQAGRTAVDLLLAALRGAPPRQIVLPTALQVRESTGPAAGA